MAAKRTGFMGSSADFRTGAIRQRSAFEAGGGDALDEEALEEHEEGKDRQQRQDRHGEKRAPIGFAGRIDEAAQAELHGIGLDVVEIDERAEKIVPGEDEGVDLGGRRIIKKKKKEG